MSKKREYKRLEGEDFVVVKYYSNKNSVSICTKYPMTLQRALRWLEKEARPLEDPRHFYKIMQME